MGHTPDDTDKVSRKKTITHLKIKFLMPTEKTKRS